MSDQPVHLIIGASGAAGRATARRLAARGARLVLAARDADRLEQAAAEVDGEVATHVLDAREIGAVKDLVDQIVEEHGRLDGAANLAGSVLIKPAHLTTPEEWEDTIALNLTSAFALVRAAAPAMRSNGGAIVLAASAAAQTGIANHEAIAAAKGGVIALVRSAAATYGARGVRVNAVAPGLVDARMTEKLVSNDAQAEASRAMHVLGRLGQGEDVGSAVAWLLDPENDWVTGQVIGVDGGLGQVHPRPRG
ncbi:MAG: SDR family oxidoreductase [Nitriliruptoraceae bacterium]|nr:SDR family oxidoreductase [Nitriliruptoraceae bacterium]